MKKISVTRMIIWLGIILFSVGVDQLTKLLAVRYLQGIETFPLWENVLHLTYCTNEGAAFGMLSDRRLIFMILSVVGILGMSVVLFLYHRAHPLFCIALSMIIGGGIGNMIDRCMLGYVIDFVDVRIIHFAVFNGADSFITVGAVLLGVYLLFIDAKTEKPILFDKKVKQSSNTDGDGNVQ